MTTRRSRCSIATILLLSVFGLVAPATAQRTAPQPAPAAPPPAPEPPAPPVPPVVEAPPAAPADDTGDVTVSEWQVARPVVRIGQDYTVPAGSSVREVTVVTGDVTIDGRVLRDVVVVLGTLRLGPEAVIEGSLVAVGTPVTVAPGAAVRRDAVIVGGQVDAPASFAPGGEQVVVGAYGLTQRVRAVLPWVTEGLLWGRLMVPSLPWMWMLAGIVFLIYLVLNVLFARAVRASADVLAAKPLSAFVVGLLVLLLVGPVTFILTVSIVGLVVVPFLMCALIVAWLIGKIAVARALGASLVAESEPENRLEATRSFVIGFVLIGLAYMVPVLGILTFILVAVFGLGSAVMALAAGLRRENPARPGPPRPDGMVVPVSVSPASIGGLEAPTTMPSSAPFAATSPDAVGVIYDQPIPPRPPVTRSQSLLAMPKATFGERAAAFALDVILVIILSAFIDVGANGARWFLMLLLIYHVVFWTLKATTVGGIICNLRIVRTDGSALGFAEALIRGLSGVFSVLVAGLGCLWILWDPERQAWHDRFAGTYVVKVPRDWAV